MSTDLERTYENELLRERLAEYERAFEAAAPRLAAFKRLEEIAREQKTTPDAVAAQAAIDVLHAEHVQATERVAEMRREHESLAADMSILLVDKKEKEEAMTIIQREHDALASEVGELMAEIESIRLDAIRLMKERSQLEMEVEALRTERDAGTAPAQATGEVEVVPGGVAHGSSLDFEGDDEDAAFSRFFDAETGKDKARDWMLG